MITPKQERQGVPGPSSEHNTAVPGPDATSEIAGRKAQAETAGTIRVAETAPLMASAAGQGFGGHAVGVGGDAWDWDSGLAVAEQPGEK